MKALSHPQAGPSICYVTPTFARDIERFALLRDSVERFSPWVPHFAYVDTEDAALFRERFRGHANLTIVPTAEILPARMEKERRFWRRWRRPLWRNVFWRYRLDTSFTGWKMQQIIKMEAAARLPFDAVAFLDSDIFLCAPVGPEEFFRDGRLLLLETAAETYEDFTFEGYRQIIMGGSFIAPADAHNYVHQAPRFWTRTARRLLEHLEATHGDWQSLFLLQGYPSEYNMLGHVARQFEAHEGYDRLEGTPDDWCYIVKHPDSVEPALRRCREEAGARRFFLMQSNMGLTDYIPVVRALLDELPAGA